jgi:hypothetical protein
MIDAMTSLRWRVDFQERTQNQTSESTSPPRFMTAVRVIMDGVHWVGIRGRRRGFIPVQLMHSIIAFGVGVVRFSSFSC